MGCLGFVNKSESLCLLFCFPSIYHAETTSSFTQREDKARLLSDKTPLSLIVSQKYCVLRNERNTWGWRRRRLCIKTAAKLGNLRLLHLSLYYQFKMFVLVELLWFYGDLFSYMKLKKLSSLLKGKSHLQTDYSLWTLAVNIEVCRASCDTFVLSGDWVFAEWVISFSCSFYFGELKHTFKLKMNSFAFSGKLGSLNCKSPFFLPSFLERFSFRSPTSWRIRDLVLSKCG